ncbi:MAG TPA: AmmeMemoRadiSam system protein B [Verrucomicrobiales bacterium]|nr:AmmeMemoRadiSam system protein B [Verrucomicrobiales bacterium]
MSAALASLVAAAGMGAGPFPLLYTDAKPFREAHAAAEAQTKPLPQLVTGVTVPHHLLALDLIAETLFLASAGRYERILILCPDHFKRSTTPFSTTTRDFLTPLGRVRVDAEAARELMKMPLLTESGLFSREHGIQAVLPSLKHWFPDVPIVPVTLGTRSTPEEWEDLLPDLIRCVEEKSTLVVQSTDFSHYLPQPEALRRDEETLRVLTAGQPDAILNLNQPEHLDSKAAQWMMMRLQRAVWNATGVVIHNRNAIHYGGSPHEPKTTSYITQIFSAETVPGRLLPGKRYCFGGDTHFGREIAVQLANPAIANRIEKSVLDATGGAPLILNLEGVMMATVPEKLRHPFQIGMRRDLTLDWLRKLNVAAVSLANNHSHDFGETNFRAMKRDLESAGIAVVENGAVIDLEHFHLGAATDVENSPEPARDLLHAHSFESWRSSTKPLFAFLHCGVEYAHAPAIRERLVASWAEKQGVQLIVGCHTHRASPRWERGRTSLRWFSMGNLLFDQNDPRNSGGVIELRFLDQGTWAARWLPLGNLFAPPG